MNQLIRLPHPPSASAHPSSSPSSPLSPGEAYRQAGIRCKNDMPVTKKTPIYADKIEILFKKKGEIKKKQKKKCRKLKWTER